MHNIALLGATGSIGTSALDVIAQYPDQYRVWALAAGSNARKLAQLASVWRPEVVAIADESRYKELVNELKQCGISSIEVLAGNEAIADLAADDQASTVIQAVVGAAGVQPSFAAARKGKRLLLANKESIVCGGALLMREVSQNNALLLPVDSEHNAVFQCLESAHEKDRDGAKLWLTCSGGPFRDKKDLDLSTVTPAMALAHPTWNMGKKISIDSATLMNKGLEVIEAHHLFNKSAEQIGVVIHPQSVVHSMVEFADGAVMAQMGCPDMKLPIAHCLGYPDRIDGGVPRLNFADLGALTFEAPDKQRFVQLAYAYEAIERGGVAAIVLNAANEVAVNAFLQEKIGFTDIAKACRAMLDSIDEPEPQSLEDILATDRMAREKTLEWIVGSRAPLES